MVRYEILMLTVPEITQDEAHKIEGHIERVIKEQKGALVSYERWGKYRLAYPVKNNDYGIYFLVRFEVEQTQASALLDALKSLFAVKVNDMVLRHMVARLDAKKSLAYQRPQALDEVPTREGMMTSGEEASEGPRHPMGEDEEETEGITEA